MMNTLNKVDTGVSTAASKTTGNANVSANGKRFSPELRERAIRLVAEQRKDYRSQWAVIESVAAKIGCSPQTLHSWIKRHEIDTGQRDGVTTGESERIKALERENKELRRANEILKLASAFFAQAELDRRLK
jgi:transposase